MATVSYWELVCLALWHSGLGLSCRLILLSSCLCHKEKFFSVFFRSSSFLSEKISACKYFLLLSGRFLLFYCCLICKYNTVQFRLMQGLAKITFFFKKSKNWIF